MKTRQATLLMALLLLSVCAVACKSSPTPTLTAMTAPTLAASTTPTPPSTATPTSPPASTSTPVPPTPTLTPHTPAPQPTPQPIKGYWIQSTTSEGLCSDYPRFIGFDRSHYRSYVGGSGATICYLGVRGLEKWPYDYPSPLIGFPAWISVNIPNIGHVTGGTAFSPYAPTNPDLPSTWGAAYGMPVFVGSGGQCVLDQEGQWRCFTAANGLPFDIRGYGIVWESNVEWFMSADSVASRGLLPQDQTYLIPELIGAAEARPTWLNVPYSQEDGVWVGTNGYGAIHIEPSAGRVTRYTTADGLPDDDIHDVQSCGGQCAWVATAGGIGHWDGARWEAYTTRDGLPSDDVCGISFADDYRHGSLWAATAGGPALLVEGSDRWQSFPDFPAGIEVNGVMYGDFSTRGQGLIHFVRASVARGHTTLVTTADGLPSNRITALAATTNSILVGTPVGAVEWDGRYWTPVTGAVVNDASSTSIATDEGLWVWDGGRWEKVNSQRILRVAEGGWYATSRQVCRWVNGTTDCPTTPDGQSLVDVRVLYADPEEGTFVAIDAQNQQWTYDAEAHDPGRFVSVYPDFMPRQINDVVARADVWHYAGEAGVYHGDVPGGDRRLTGGWPIPVRQISLNEATGDIWITTNQGAFYQPAFDPGREWGWTYVAGLPNQNLTTVLALPAGDAWFGTADAGLIHFEPVVP